MLSWLPGLDQLQPGMMSGCFLVSGVSISFPRVTVNVFCSLFLENTFFFLMFTSQSFCPQAVNRFDCH